MIVIFIWESVGAIRHDFDDLSKFRAVLVGARFLFKRFWPMLYTYMGWVWGWIAFTIEIMIWESVGAIGGVFENFQIHLSMDCLRPIATPQRIWTIPNDPLAILNNPITIFKGP